MKVKTLIKELKKMPRNLEVATASHDNADYEIQGFVSSVHHVIKPENPEDISGDIYIVPDEREWVTLR